jgi:uncharacterized membrane protein YqjE
MVILDTLGRLATTFITIVQTRLELVAVEMEEESLRFLGYLALCMLAMVCISLTITLLTLFVIVLFWDSYRIASILGMALLYGLAAAALLAGVRSNFRSKPKLLSFTLAELNKDVASMKALGQTP